MMTQDMTIKTGIKFFGQSILIESSGDGDVDEALKTLFVDGYNKTAPLYIKRPDSQIVLEWLKEK